MGRLIWTIEDIRVVDIGFTHGIQDYGPASLRCNFVICNFSLNLIQCAAAKRFVFTSNKNAFRLMQSITTTSASLACMHRLVLIWLGLGTPNQCLATNELLQTRADLVQNTGPSTLCHFLVVCLQTALVRSVISIRFIYSHSANTIDHWSLAPIETMVESCRFARPILGADGR